MAGFADLVRKMVAVADSLTASLHASVTHYAWASATVDSYNKVTWGTGTVRLAVVEPNRRLIRRDSGTEVQARFKLTFPRSVSVDTRDRIVLSDGTTGPIIDVKGLTDPGTGLPYATEVWLGSDES